MSRQTVTVIGGGANCEHEVSLASAASVSAALDPTRFVVQSLTIGRDGGWQDAAGTSIGLSRAVAAIQHSDVVFPAVHGPGGEDGSLAALLEFANVPYVGSGVRAGALAMDKQTTKLIAQSVGVRTAPGVVVTASSDPLPTMTLPLVTKPVAAGSSYGVTLVTRAAELGAAIDAALQFDDRVLVEQCIVGREVDIAVLGRADGTMLVSAPLEIVVDNGVFDTELKYDGSADFRVPADVSDRTLRDLHAQSQTLFAALGCAGVARFDYFVTDAGLVLNEVNTMPGMTAQSQVPRMFAAVGLEYRSLLTELVDAALSTPKPRR
ncbi:MAG TPA: D-alanine--D-alanine ligase [Candidatus Lumbricidophila sp.]|nr:D-alanine--D-alanine ligase [Candidatus Lumbricidophila sp.]